MATAKANRCMVSLVIVLMLVGVSLININAQTDFTPFERLYFVRLTESREEAGEYEPITHIYSMKPGDAPIQETMNVRADVPMLSPNGRYLVYQAFPPLITAALERGEDVYSEYFCCGPYPTEIHLINLTKPHDDPTRITRLTDPLRLDEITTDLSPYHFNSTSIWSPDGTQLAWVEYFQGRRILVYDTRTRATHTIVLPFIKGYGDGSDWGVPGLEGWGDGMVHTFTTPGLHMDGSFGDVLVIFSNTGGGLFSHVITYLTSKTDEYDYWLRSVQHDGEWRLLMYYKVTGFVLFDPSAGTFAVLDDLPAYESINGSGWQGVIVPDPRSASRLGGQHLKWRVNGVMLEHQPPNTLNFATFDPSGTPLFIDLETKQLVYWSSEAGTSAVLPHELADWKIGSAEWVPGVWTVTGETIPVEQTCCELWRTEPDGS